MKKLIEMRECYDCGQLIEDETIEQYPDTEICGDCLYLDSENYPDEKLIKNENIF